MKAILSTLTSLVLVSAVAEAQQAAPAEHKQGTPAPAQAAAPEPTLKPGSEVKLDSVTSAKWIQGEAPKEFEPGKIYIFECWATWCGPCIASIPHVNELHKKYHDKGLRVYGMNVWEDGQDKVEKFVKGKGEGMSYAVAYTGKGSAFETDWLKAAGARGIPFALLVKDGKLLFTTHPALLTDSMIEDLLAGKEGAAEQATQKINAAHADQEQSGKLLNEFHEAAAKNDVDTMSAKLEAFEKLTPKSTYLPAMRLSLLIAKKDWPAAIKAIENLPDGPAQQIAMTMTANNLGLNSDAECPVDFLKAFSKTFDAMLKAGKLPINPMYYVTLSSLQWKGGEKEDSIASARKAVAIAAENKLGTSIPAEPFERYAKSLEDGKLPSGQEFSGWIGEVMKKRKAVPAGKIQAPPAAK